MEGLNKISFEGKLMLRFTDNIINLWFEGLPKDVHFSLSINKNSSDINFHVTREVNNPRNKPKNDVFVIARNICDDLMNDLAKHLLHQTLTELDITEILETGNARFIPHSNFEKSDFYFSVEKELNQLASNILKPKGRKALKIKNNAAVELENFNTDATAFMELCNESVGLDEMQASGIIITAEKVYSVINFNGKWYIPKSSLTINDFLISFLGKRLAEKIFYCTQKAIVIVKNASSFDEIRHLNKPFRISKKKMT